MRCLDCGMNYVGMKSVNKYNCPHCSVVDVETGEV
jgi:DNA-directed RNA polymerase subunit RPC12/RpoP